MRNFEITIDPTEIRNLDKQIEDEISALPEVEDGEVWVQRTGTVIRFKGDRENIRFWHTLSVELWLTDATERGKLVPSRTLRFCDGKVETDQYESDRWID